MHSSLLSLVPLLATGSVAGPVKQLQPRGSGGFCNTVFNTDAFSFTLGPLRNNINYNLGSGSPCPEGDDLEAARIPIVMDPANLDAAKKLLTDSPPGYLELYNEPDYSYENYTPITSPKDSANGLRPLFAIGASTQFISPAVAYTGSDWLKEFQGNCTECMDKIGIIGAHVYSVEPQGAIDQIKNVHDQWPDKRIWVTEIGPSTGDPKCQYDAAGMSDWMTKVVNQVKALEYVDRIFWNTGTWSILNNNPNACNPSLTKEDGTATDLLKTYAGLWYL
ncbi:MAG: hypothetical protein Q9170_001779 [Blastenia crenularia]